MAYTDPVHPLAGAAVRALARADSLADDRRARWVPDEHAWKVPSSQPDVEPYTVTRRHPASNVADETGHIQSKHTGYGWAFILTCTCPAEAGGHMICWHKAAVYRWWQANRRVDGDAYGDLEAHSLAAAHAANDLDAEGVERRKDRLLGPQERGGAALAAQDAAAFADNPYPETEVERDLRLRGVPERSSDADFDPGPGSIRAMIENTRRLLAGEELPR